MSKVAAVTLVVVSETVFSFHHQLARVVLKEKGSRPFLGCEPLVSVGYGAAFTGASSWLQD
jgi:hypothetical protein